MDDRLPVMSRRQGSVIAWAAGTICVQLAPCALASSPAPERVRALTADILSSPGYQVNPPLSWYLERWLVQQLQRLVEALQRLSGSETWAGLPSWLWWIMVGVSVTLLTLLLAHLVLSVRGLMVEPRRERRAQAAGERPPTPQQVLREAQAAAAAGQFARGLRLLYQAALLRLDRQQVLRYDPARTNWENLQAALRRTPQLRPDLTDLTAVVDRCVYGATPATREVYLRCQALVERIWRVEVAADA